MSNFRYQLAENKNEKLNIQLLYISTARFEKDWHSTQHTHHFTELFYVIQGRGNFIVDEKIFEVKADDLIIINPNISHTEVGIDGTPLEYIVLGIEGLIFVEPAEEEQSGYRLLNYYNFKHEILFYLKTLVQEIEKKDDNYTNICQNLLEVLILNMLRRTSENLQITSVRRSNKECDYVKRYIDSHFQEDITLDQLSSLTYVNKFYLSHAFKKYMGVSPINYMIDRRIDEAKNLLETTNYSVAQISEFIGFSSQSYFSQIFKKKMEVSPNQFRRMHRADNI